MLMVVVLVGATLVVLLLLWRGVQKASATQARSIYLIGLSGSGKTPFFHQLQGRGKLKTTVSMTPNEGRVEVGENLFRVVDVPSFHNPALFLRDRLCAGDRLIFLVDSARSQNLYESASRLYQLVVAPWFCKLMPRVRVLSVVGPSTPPFAEFKRELQAELTRLKISHRTSVHESNGDDYLAAAPGDFSFEQIRGDFQLGELTPKASLEELRQLL